MRNSNTVQQIGVPGKICGLSHYLAGVKCQIRNHLCTSIKNLYLILTGRFPKT